MEWFPWIQSHFIIMPDLIIIWIHYNHNRNLISEVCSTMKPYLAATSVLRPLHYSCHISKVQASFPSYFIDLISIHVVTLSLSAKNKRTKLMCMPLYKVASGWAWTLSDDKVAASTALTGAIVFFEYGRTSIIRTVRLTVLLEYFDSKCCSIKRMCVLLE